MTVDLEDAFIQIDRPASCVRSGESHQAWRGTVSFARLRVKQRDPLGPLLFVLALHGVVSEGLAHAEAAGSPVDLAAFHPDGGSICGTHKATKGFLEDLQLGLDHRSFNMNPSKCEYIPAKPLPSSALLLGGGRFRSFGLLPCAPTA